ncbi:MAG: ComF family protein [Candidatus Peregrinibacteria bacterium]|nr:ComF family protein [Candidatus Peregrinibacteria bacterium]
MKWLQLFLEFLFPNRCLGCRRTGLLLCMDCLVKIPIQQRIRSPVEKDWSLDGLLVISPYLKGEILQKAIQAMKYQNGSSLAEILGQWMATHSIGIVKHELGSENIVLVPVPLHPKREKKRGYNQARLLALAVSGFSVLLKPQLPLIEPLQRIRNTPPQAQLSRNDRIRNLSDSFIVKENSLSLNKKIVLVDDVCSTGSTLNECARVLKQHGAHIVWGLVLARG